MTADFGNGFDQLRRVSVFGLVLAALLFILSVCVGYIHDTLSAHWLMAIIVPLIIGALVPIPFLLTTLFSIRLDDRHVTHFFLRRFILSQHPLSELVSARFFGPVSPVVFRFADGSTIRFIGAHLGIISAMRRRLFELRPDLAS